MQITTTKNNNGVMVNVDFENENTVSDAMLSLCAISEAIITHLATNVQGVEYNVEDMMKSLYTRLGMAMLDQAFDIENSDEDEHNYN